MRRTARAIEVPNRLCRREEIPHPPRDFLSPPPHRRKKSKILEPDRSCANRTGHLDVLTIEAKKPLDKPYTNMITSSSTDNPSQPPNQANSFTPILLQTVCRSRKSQVLWNQANPHRSCKNRGWRVLATPLFSRWGRSDAPSPLPPITSLQPLQFHAITHSFAQRPPAKPFHIRRLRTLFIATGGGTPHPAAQKQNAPECNSGARTTMRLQNNCDALPLWRLRGRRLRRRPWRSRLGRSRGGWRATLRRIRLIVEFHDFLRHINIRGGKKNRRVLRRSIQDGHIAVLARVPVQHIHHLPPDAVEHVRLRRVYVFLVFVLLPLQLPRPGFPFALQPLLLFGT